MAWRRAIEETQLGIASARDQAEAELRRRWALLRDSVDQALDVGLSLEDVARWLGLSPTTLSSLINREAGILPA